MPSNHPRQKELPVQSLWVIEYDDLIKFKHHLYIISIVNYATMHTRIINAFTLNSWSKAHENMILIVIKCTYRAMIIIIKALVSYNISCMIKNIVKHTCGDFEWQS